MRWEHNDTVPHYTSGGLPLNTLAVQEVITDFGNSYNLMRAQENSFLRERINELSELYRVAYLTEKQFFDDFGLDDQDMKVNLMQFQKKLDEISTNSGIDKIIGLNFYKAFMSDINVMNAIEHNSARAVQEMVANNSELLLGNFGDLENNDKSKFLIIDAFNQMLRNKSSSTYFLKSTKRGLYKYLLYVEEKDNIPGHWTFNFDANEEDNNRLDPGIKKRFITLLNDEANFTNLGDSEFRQYINNIIQKNINVNFLPYIQTEIKNMEGYSLSKNEQVIKGYVEEICMNAAFSYLTDNNYRAKNRIGKTIPTGAIRAIEGGYQIPIDILLSNYGFQIKSWTLSEGTYTDRTHINAGNFIVGTLQLSYYDTLIALFGSYQFNQEYNVAYTMDDEFKRIMDVDDGPLQQIFASYLDRIIRLNHRFSSSLAALAAKTTYSNTFYLVGGKLVPGSELLLAMIESFEEQQYNPTSLTFNLTKITNQYNNSLGQLIESENHERNATRYRMNIFDMANLVRLEYEVTFDIDRLIKQAYNHVLNNS